MFISNTSPYLFTYVNNPIVNNSHKIYGGMFGGVNYNPYLCIVSGSVRRRVRETGSSLRGWTPTCLYKKEIPHVMWGIVLRCNSSTLSTVSDFSNLSYDVIRCLLICLYTNSKTLYSRCWSTIQWIKLYTIYTTL